MSFATVRLVAGEDINQHIEGQHSILCQMQKVATDFLALILHTCLHLSC